LRGGAPPSETRELSLEPGGSACDQQAMAKYEGKVSQAANALGLTPKRSAFTGGWTATVSRNGTAGLEPIIRSAGSLSSAEIFGLSLCAGLPAYDSHGNLLGVHDTRPGIVDVGIIVVLHCFEDDTETLALSGPRTRAVGKPPEMVEASEGREFSPADRGIAHRRPCWRGPERVAVGGQAARRDGDSQGFEASLDDCDSPRGMDISAPRGGSELSLLFLRQCRRAR